MTPQRNPERLRLKYAATINDEALTEDTDASYELRYVDIGDVDSSGHIHDSVSYTFSEAPSRARRRVRDGDIIVSCVRTYLQAIAPIQGPPNNLIVSTGFAVVRPRVGVLDAAFAKYALRQQSFLTEVNKRSVGVSYPAINASDLGEIFLPLPPEGDQRMIAEYLDRETVRLDALIATKERMLGLLAEKRQSLVTRAITRGLEAGGPLLDSGVSWLGKIPARWQTERARWLFAERDERTSTGEEELLTVSHLTGVTPRSEKVVNMFEAATNEGYKICRSGDLVVNTMWAWMGAMGLAKQDGIVSPAYNVYEPAACLDPRYLEALVRLPAFAEEATRYSVGVWSSRLRLYPQGFFAISIPVPPLSVQREIADHIASTTNKLDEVRTAIEGVVALLKERRGALISEAVTRQVVPERIR